MYRSKRFLAFCVAVVLFTIMTYTTTYTPLELAGGISIITGIYIGAQSLRASGTEK